MITELANTLALAGNGTPPARPVETLAELTQIAQDSGLFPADYSIEQTERLLGGLRTHHPAAPRLLAGAVRRRCSALRRRQARTPIN